MIGFVFNPHNPDWSVIHSIVFYGGLTLAVALIGFVLLTILDRPR